MTQEMENKQHFFVSQFIYQVYIKNVKYFFDEPFWDKKKHEKSGLGRKFLVQLNKNYAT